MTNKVRLISTISAICMVLALLTVGVWAVSSASVTLGGSVSFTADNVHARITGNVTGTQETISLPNLEYDVNTDVNSTDFQSKLSSWANNDMTFTSENLITMTITVENLSGERSLFVTLTDNTTTDNVGKTLKQGASNYTSGSAVEVTAGNTTTFTMTLSVTDKNQSASATVSYQVDLRDANAEVEEVLDQSEYPDLKFNKLDEAAGNKFASVQASSTNISGEIVIPSKVMLDGEEYTVTEIASADANTGIGAFCACTQITSIKLPDTLTVIGDGGFTMTGITEITIPDNVTSIGVAAFGNCTGLTDITIPNKVTTIGESAFYGCTALNHITIPNSVISMGPSVFRDCNILPRIEIPSSVNSIEAHTFSGCSGLTHVIIGSGVTSIGDNAFGGCYALEIVVIDSETVASALAEQESMKNLIYNATTIYIKTDIVIADKVGSYVTNTTNFPNVETITEGEYAGYTKYSK